MENDGKTYDPRNDSLSGVDQPWIFSLVGAIDRIGIGGVRVAVYYLKFMQQLRISTPGVRASAWPSTNLLTLTSSSPSFLPNLSPLRHPSLLLRQREVLVASGSTCCNYSSAIRATIVFANESPFSYQSRLCFYISPQRRTLSDLF